MNRTPSSDDRFVSATEMASLAFCETKVALETKAGELVTREQGKARARGEDVHKHVDVQARRNHNQPDHQGRTNPCYIATCVYGHDDSRTWELRAFRDNVLRRHRAGRQLIAMYYQTAPAVVCWLSGHRMRTAITRTVIDLIRWIVSPWTGDGDEHQRQQRAVDP